MKQSHDLLLQSALRDYDIASNELMRPEEDVVASSVCILTKNAIGKILMFYLHNNNVSFLKDDTLENLMKRCAEKDKSFLQIDMAPLRCSCRAKQSESEEYCLSIEKTSQCFRLLEEIKSMVFSRLNISKGNNFVS